MRDRSPAARRAAVRVFRLGEEPGDDLSDVTTAEERLEHVATLSRRMWALTGRASPEYTRGTMPVRIVRRP